MQLRKNKRRNQRGLMLIEILVVVTIIGIISAIVGIGVFHALTGAQIDTTKTQISKLGDALELYRMRFHKYPENQEGLAALAKPPFGPPIMDDVPRDPWDNEYIYSYPGRRATHKYDIVSKGPDGLADTEDDIVNNKQPLARAANP
jgi:general secretion pathway protein G